jgi:hypothetical protein
MASVNRGKISKRLVYDCLNFIQNNTKKRNNPILLFPVKSAHRVFQPGGPEGFYDF